MRERVAVAAVIAAILLYMVFVYWPERDSYYQREYKDVYEQMRMERMITGRITDNGKNKSW